MSPSARRASAIVLFLAITSLLPAAWGSASAAVALTEQETARLLRIVSNPGDRDLKALPGMTPEAAQKITAHVGAGKKFASLDELTRVSGLSDAQIEQLASVVRHPPVVKKLGQEAAELTPEEAYLKSQATQPKTGGGKKGLAPADQKSKAGQPPANPDLGLNLEVKPNYYSALPGFDLSKMSEDKKKRFLDTVNQEPCSCGCEHPSLAYCLVNDPECPVAKARIKKIQADISEAPATPAAP
jgi:hypothetical protein